MLQTTLQAITTPPPFPSIIQSLYAKVGAELYQVELNYKVNGKFLLRPTSGKPYQTITATAEQVRALRLFPIFGGV